MRRLSPHFLALIGTVLGVLAPVAASAESLNPVGGNAWDFYVYGNGSVIAQVLTALKLLLAPQGGGGGFRTLLLAISMLGFLALAVRAGFDPAKNFLKMFAFIFLIAIVMYGTEEATVNVTVTDQLTGYINTVPGVPAIVGLPASLISEAGYWLTNEIEQDFSTPSSMKLSGGGQFDMFGKVLSDMNDMVITDPDLKRSLSAYVSDCVVPAMALGNVTASELLNSNDLLGVLKQAQSPALLTRYYPMSGSNSTCTALSTTASGYSSQLGALMECSQAYTCFSADIANYAPQLAKATDQQWETTGIMVPFETAMTDALAQAASSGSGSAIAGNSSPEGLIMQTALANSMRGAFRGAAARLGNNSLMLSTALAQADQSQLTSWYTASEIFKNLMGYVYIVLQAFVIGVVPVVIIALMIPGLGGKIFVNYIEVLVWLTLWSPIMAILNFLITAFGGSELHTALSGGYTLQNAAAITSYTNKLVIAAQFLGTMIPLLTWGLVRGSLAFTEFITHGIGSSFATQAGAQASTGNVSMGNYSLGNVGLDKYNTSMVGEVGGMDLRADQGIGRVENTDFQGGSWREADGVKETKSITKGTGVTVTADNGFTQSMTAAQASSFVDAKQKALQQLKQWGTDLQNMRQNLEKEAAAQQASQGFVSQDKVAAAEQISKAEQVLSQAATKLTGGATVSTTEKAGDTDGIPIFGVNVKAKESVGYDMSHLKSDTQTAMHDAKNSYDHAMGHDTAYKTDASTSSDGSIGSSAASKESVGAAMQSMDTQSQQLTENLGRAEAWTKSIKVTSNTSQTTQTTEGALNTGGADIDRTLAAANREISQHEGNLAGETAGISGAVTQARGQFGHDWASAQNAANRAAAQLTVPTGHVAGVKKQVADGAGLQGDVKKSITGGDSKALRSTWGQIHAQSGKHLGIFNPLTGVAGHLRTVPMSM